MKLDVIQSAESSWYADGLRFTCAQCGNCCTGGPGYVWISREEIARLATHLKLTAQQVIERYCRKVDGKLSLKEVRTPAGLYDCIFLREEKVPAGGDHVAGERVVGDRVVQTKRTCGIYSVRPLQCRTWPFWSSNLRDEQSWNRAAKGCHGMNQGRKFEITEIAALRDAKDWPQKPPTSGE